MNRTGALFSDTLDHHSQTLFVCVLLALLLGMIVFIGLDHSYWGDEAAFVSTIRYFGQNFTLRSLTDYDQVIAPLVFLLYTLWGKLTSFEIHHLRLLSLGFSLVTFILIFRLYAATLARPREALLASCLLLLNPYALGLSFFVFTDIPNLCFLLLIAWAVYRQNLYGLGLATAAALLGRQYSAFLVVAAFFYYLVMLHRGDKSKIVYPAALVLGSLPLLILFFFWGGIAPPTGKNLWVRTEVQLYHPGYLTTYVVFVAAYLMPVVIWMRHHLFHNRRLCLYCGAISFWYFLFPVRASIVVIRQTGQTTVGLLHRLIQSGLNNTLLEHTLFWILFWSGLVILARIFSEDIRRFRRGEWDFGHFLSLAVICFFLVMPFSYQIWEKYLISILPFLLLRLMMIRAADRYEASFS